MITRSTILGVFFSICTFVSFAQDAATQPQEETKKFEPTLHAKGYTQLNFAYGQLDGTDNFDENPYGFSLRRVRFMPYGEFSENISWGILFSADKLSPGLITAYMNFKLKEDLVQLKAGLIDNPGARQGAGISSSKLVLVQRAPIVQAWAGNFHTKGYYDVGVKLHGKAGKLKYALLIANASATNAFTGTSVKGNFSHDSYNGLKEVARIDFAPIEGLEIGGFGGFTAYNSVIADSLRDFTSLSYGGDLAYKANGMEIQAGYIGGATDELMANDTIESVEYNGLYLHGGYKIGNIMPTCGFDMYNPESNSDNAESYMGISVGMNAFVGKNVKFQANYVHRLESENEIDNNLIILNIQYVFGKKNL